MPGACLTMVETEIVLGALKARLNRPAQPRRAGQFAQRDAHRRKGKVVGPLVGLAPAAPDQEPVLEAWVSGRRQRDPRPLAQPQPLRALASSAVPFPPPPAACVTQASLARASAIAAGVVSSSPSSLLKRR